MFTNISWANYITIIALLVTAYYSFIGIKIFHREIRQLLSGKNKLGARLFSKVNVKEDEQSNIQLRETQPELFPADTKYFPSRGEIDDIFERVDQLKEEIKQAIKEAALKNYIKEEFILSLQRLLKKYHFLKDTPFLVAINNIIAVECQKYRYIQLNAEERLMLWNE